jgi:hypothetical protein
VDIRSQGAKYPDKFTIDGDLDATSGFTLNLVADFSNVHVSAVQAAHDAHPAVLVSQLQNSAYASNLFVNGTFLDAAETYTVNLNNIGGTVGIKDWTVLQNLNSEVGFLLFTATNSALLSANNWVLAGNLNVGDGWSLKWMDYATSGHQLWLFYANPTRIPEPATTAAIFARLILGATASRRCLNHRKM